MVRFVSVAVAALLVSSAQAQIATPTLAPTPAPVAILGTSPSNVLRTGLAIPMRTREELTTKAKALRVGQRVALEVAEDIRLNGQVVIPAGSPGVAEITSVRNKGMWGKSGYVNARVLSLRVGDRSIRMSGTFDDKGKTGTGGVVASIALIPLAGFFTTGTSAMIPLGAPVNAFLDEDVPVSFASAAAVAPLTVPASSSVTNTIATPAPGAGSVIPVSVVTAPK